MKNTLLSTCFITAVLAVTGCSDTQSSPQAVSDVLTFSGVEFKLLTGKVTVTDGKIMTGTAKLLAVKPPAEMGADVSLSVEMADGKNSSVKVILYADVKLANGIEALFTTAPDKDDATNALKFYSKLDGKMRNVPLRGTSLVDGKGELGIDLHSTHGHGDVLIDSRKISDFDFNTADETNSDHKFWGIELDGATIKSITAKFGPEVH